MSRLLIILFLALSLASCGDSSLKTLDEIRQIEVGLTEMEVQYILGEPREVEVEIGYEEWYYTYDTHFRNNTFRITIQDDKVINYTSY